MDEAIERVVAHVVVNPAGVGRGCQDPVLLDLIRQLEEAHAKCVGRTPVGIPGPTTRWTNIPTMGGAFRLLNGTLQYTPTTFDEEPIEDMAEDCEPATAQEAALLSRRLGFPVEFHGREARHGG